MGRKVHAARRKAFLRVLGETGNKSLAAERAKVSYAWIGYNRARDPAFRRATDEAVARAAARLAGQPRPPSGWGFLDGAELVVRGTGGAAFREAQRGRTGQRVQIARARVLQWSPRLEDRFLAVLAATCNVRAACAAVGIGASSAYAHRRRWPAFAARWRDAVEQGYLRLECGLIEAAGNFLSGEGVPDAESLTGMTVQDAIHLLHMHRQEVRGIGKPHRPRAREPDIEEVRAEILRKVEALRGADRRQLARDRAEWARRRAATQRSCADDDPDADRGQGVSSSR